MDLTNKLEGRLVWILKKKTKKNPGKEIKI
jgi:hypothetical protein